MKAMLSFCFMCCLTLATLAQEGMWLLSQLDQIDLAKRGMQLQASDVYSADKPSLSNAILQIGGGSGSFVSPEGLVLTNHHVAFGAIQRVSTSSNDLLSNGFLATKRSDEIKAEGYSAYMLTEMKDVTAEVLEAVKGITDPTEKDKKITAKIAAMTEVLKKDKKDVSVYIAQMYDGKQYIEFIYKEFKDIRLVYAPPKSIGNYGGETDNWMWPRHTGDFSFFRVYVAPDGTGAAYNVQNVPYKPKVWLKVAKDPLKDGDLAFILGFPGYTTRYRTSTSVHWNQEYNYPFTIKNYREIIDMAEEITKHDPDGKIKIAGLTKGLANTMKNYEGKVEGMKKTNYLQHKIEFEKSFMQWVNSDPGRKEKYGTLLSREKDQYVPLEKTKDRDNVFGLFQGLAGTWLSLASQIYYIAKEKEKPNDERNPNLTEEALKETLDNLHYYYDNYYEPVDKALLVRSLKMAGELPADQGITGLDYILTHQGETLAQFVDKAYTTSKLKDLEYAKSIFNKSSKELEALNDPFINMVAALYPLGDEIQKTQEKFAANVTDLRKQYMDALYAWKGQQMYPDANGTIRFTSGRVKGYKPRNAVWYEPFTSLQGVIEKNTGVEPFDAPANLVELYNKKDFGRWMDPMLKDVPVAFLSQCDITGGNSGSPVMNAKGELIGVVFDGNYEAMISDWQYDIDMQRAITCDIRYVLFITQKVANAGYLLDEMQVKR